MPIIDLNQLRQRAEAAAKKFAEAKARLYRPDGTPVFTNAEHDRRLQELAAERDEVLDGVIETAQEERVAAETEAARLRDGDPAQRRAWRRSRSRSSGTGATSPRHSRKRTGNGTGGYAGPYEPTEAT